MNRYTLHLRIHLRGPVLSRSTKAGSYGIDTPMAESSDGTNWCLPNTLVKGRLAEGLRDLAKQAPKAFAGRFPTLHRDGFRILFGEASHQSDRGDFGNVDPWRGSVHFTDFLAPKNNRTLQTRTRTSIDPLRGAVDEGAMEVIETPFLSGEPIAFLGSLDFVAEDQARADEITDFLITGFHWLCQIGGARGIGFGKVVTVDHCLVARILPKLDHSTHGTCLPFVICPQGPLCIAPGDPRGNFFRSSDIIPGEMILGAFAETWKQAMDVPPSTLVSRITAPDHATLAKHFDKIRVSHAFPCSKGAGRPIVPPLSLAKVPGKGGPERLVDLWNLEFANLIDGEAPAFRVDWKDSGDVMGSHGWPCLQRELRVHTAVNKHQGNRNRRAEDAKLFSMECLIPGNHVWSGHFDLHEVPEDDLPAVGKELADLLAKLGLRNLGKTKQVAEVEWLLNPLPWFASCLQPVEASLYVITLQTPALLADPRFSNAAGIDGQTDREQQMHAAYSEVWTEISEGSLQLSHFFASQRLFGGNYFYKRFQGGGNYVPLLLTEPGSVFVLKLSNPEKAKEFISQWFAHGLPLPKWAIENHGNTWQKNTFLPQHGYGEIAVNIHLESQPELPSGHE